MVAVLFHQRVCCPQQFVRVYLRDSHTHADMCDWGSRRKQGCSVVAWAWAGLGCWCISISDTCRLARYVGWLNGLKECVLRIGLKPSSSSTVAARVVTLRLHVSSTRCVHYYFSTPLQYIATAVHYDCGTLPPVHYHRKCGDLHATFWFHCMQRVCSRPSGMRSHNTLRIPCLCCLLSFTHSGMCCQLQHLISYSERCAAVRAAEQSDFTCVCAACAYLHAVCMLCLSTQANVCAHEPPDHRC